MSRPCDYCGDPFPGLLIDGSEFGMEFVCRKCMQGLEEGMANAGNDSEDDITEDING